MTIVKVGNLTLTQGDVNELRAKFGSEESVAAEPAPPTSVSIEELRARYPFVTVPSGVPAGYKLHLAYDASQRGESGRLYNRVVLVYANEVAAVLVREWPLDQLQAVRVRGLRLRVHRNEGWIRRVALRRPTMTMNQ